jgi:hypothetical protein
MWNDYFSRMTSQDNPYLHPFYREFFDKPSGKRWVRTITPTRLSSLDPPNLQSSLDRISHRIPHRSKAVSVVARRRERGWNERFCVTYSKRNDYCYKTLREYFDRSKRIEGEKLRLQALNYTQVKRKPVRVRTMTSGQRRTTSSSQSP